MFKSRIVRVIAIEEPMGQGEKKQLAGTFTGHRIRAGPRPQLDRLYDLGALRLKEMDEGGIDIQVISTRSALGAEAAATTAVGHNARVR